MSDYEDGKIKVAVRRKRKTIQPKGRPISSRQENIMLSRQGFDLEGLIGEGGNGKVYSGTYEGDLDYVPREVAIKTLEKGYRVKTDAEKRDLQRIITKLTNNLRTIQNLNHRALPEVYGFFITQDEFERKHFNVVMERIEGETLFEKMEEGVSCRDSLSYGIELLKFLRHITSREGEEPLVYRDISPRNIVVENDNHNIRVLDFDGLTTVDPLLGTSVTIRVTPEYAAEEAIIGEAVPASDVYSVGIIMYEMITGEKVTIKREFDYAKVEEEVFEVTDNEEYSKMIRSIIEKMTVRNLDQRYDFAAEVLDDLAKAQKFIHREEDYRLTHKNWRTLERLVNDFYDKNLSLESAPEIFEEYVNLAKSCDLNEDQIGGLFFAYKGYVERYKNHVVANETSGALINLVLGPAVYVASGVGAGLFGVIMFAGIDYFSGNLMSPLLYSGAFVTLSAVSSAIGFGSFLDGLGATAKEEEKMRYLESLQDPTQQLTDLVKLLERIPDESVPFLEAQIERADPNTTPQEELKTALMISHGYRRKK